LTDPIDGRFALSLGRVSEVLNVDVGAREDLGLVSVLPAHEVRRCAVLPEHLQDLSIALLLSLVMSSNHEPIAGACSQS
jgi:hypothetical protein